jgi:hypothetical protein
VTECTVHCFKYFQELQVISSCCGSSTAGPLSTTNSLRFIRSRHVVHDIPPNLGHRLPIHFCHRTALALLRTPSHPRRARHPPWEVVRRPKSRDPCPRSELPTSTIRRPRSTPARRPFPTSPWCRFRLLPTHWRFEGPLAIVSFILPHPRPQSICCRFAHAYLVRAPETRRRDAHKENGCEIAGY